MIGWGGGGIPRGGLLDDEGLRGTIDRKAGGAPGHGSSRICHGHLGRRTRRDVPPVHENGLEALGLEDHRPSCGRGGESADDLPDHPARHQPGHFRIRRSSGRCEQDVCADAQSRLVGENPCNIDRLFRKIKQFGFHARQGGGVSGVEMALWDLAGKAYGVPVYQMLGGRFRDRIRCYADTDSSRDPKVFAARLKERMDQGFTFLKMDLGIGLLQGIPGAVTRPLGQTNADVSMTEHMFTGIDITPKGIEALADYVAQVREAIGMEIPLAADHFGHIGVNACIKLGKALEKYNLAWLEDMIPCSTRNCGRRSRTRSTSPR